MNWRERLIGLVSGKKFQIIGLVLGIVVVLGALWFVRLGWMTKPGTSTDAKGNDVAVPTIINGDLILPKVGTLGGELSPGTNNFAPGKLGVISALLIPITSQQQGGQPQLTGIQVIGETVNLGSEVVSQISPVIRFYDADGKLIGQKVGRLSDGWDFFGVSSNETTLYNVTVDKPPQADKLEIVLNAAAATTSAIYDELKIASRSVEIKTATYQGPVQNQESSTSSGATESGTTTTSPNTQSVQYYTVTGGIINTLSDPISDISVYSWIKDAQNKVFAYSRQDFKNDLLMPGDKVDFRINLLPLKDGESYAAYEVAAWGKRYKLNL